MPEVAMATPTCSAECVNKQPQSAGVAVWRSEPSADRPLTTPGRGGILA